VRRRPSRQILWSAVAVLGIALTAVLLGLFGLVEAVRVASGLVAIGSARRWSGYWAARDRFEAWRKRIKR
jgi:hypothetical protein